MLGATAATAAPATVEIAATVATDAPATVVIGAIVPTASAATATTVAARAVPRATGPIAARVPIAGRASTHHPSCPSGRGPSASGRVGPTAAPC